MGTNYYKASKVKSEHELEIIRLMNDIETYNLASEDKEKLLYTIDELLNNQSIHLGKLSHGWRPLLKVNDDVKDWIEFRDNLIKEESGIQIKDEYGSEYTALGFINKFENHLVENKETDEYSYLCPYGMRWIHGEFS